MCARQPVLVVVFDSLVTVVDTIDAVVVVVCVVDSARPFVFLSQLAEPTIRPTWAKRLAIDSCLATTIRLTTTITGTKHRSDAYDAVGGPRLTSFF